MALYGNVLSERHLHQDAIRHRIAAERFVVAGHVPGSKAESEWTMFFDWHRIAL
jgi:hypothetical protein